MKSLVYKPKHESVYRFTEARKSIYQRNEIKYVTFAIPGSMVWRDGHSEYRCIKQRRPGWNPHRQARATHLRNENLIWDVLFKDWTVLNLHTPDVGSEQLERSTLFGLNLCLKKTSCGGRATLQRKLGRKFLSIWLNYRQFVYFWLQFILLTSILYFGNQLALLSLLVTPFPEHHLTSWLRPGGNCKY